MNEDGDVVVSTKLSRRDYDRFVAIATRIGQTQSAILRGFIQRCNEAFLSREGELDELWATRRRLEAGFAKVFEELIVAEVTASTLRPGEDEVTRVYKQLIAKANQGDDGKLEEAVRDLQSQPERVRTAVGFRLAKDLPDLWHRIRPLVLGRPRSTDPGGDTLAKR